LTLPPRLTCYGPMKVQYPNEAWVGVHPGIEGVLVVYDGETDHEAAFAITCPDAALKISADIAMWANKLKACAELGKTPIEDMARA
jgi:hypothetical protein